MSGSTELRQKGGIEKNKAYVVVLSGTGREHNIVIDQVGDEYLYGYVALARAIILIEKPDDPFLMLRIEPLNRLEAIKKEFNILVEEGCAVRSSSQRIRVRLDQASLIEDSWRPLVDEALFDEYGDPRDDRAVVDQFPSLKAYYLFSGKFVKNLQAWPGDTTVSKVEVIDPNAKDYSSSDE